MKGPGFVELENKIISYSQSLPLANNSQCKKWLQNRDQIKTVPVGPLLNLTKIFKWCPINTFS